MLLSRRPVAADPVIEQRIGRLLTPSLPVGGWLPPAEDAEPEQAPLSQEPAEERSWAPRHGALPGLLPDTLAGGRLDPGHRGAVALLLVCVLAAVITAGVVLRDRPQEVALPAVESTGTVLPGLAEPTPAASPAPTELVVAVVGDVAAPGVVRLPPGARVDDALRAAGGLRPGGSAGLLNLARPLTDGEQVVVGPDALPDPPAGAQGGGITASGLLDLNRATAADLERLPGIGPVLAARIAAWRDEHDGFASVDQLREVPGIGESKYAALKAEVTV